MSVVLGNPQRASRELEAAVAFGDVALLVPRGPVRRFRGRLRFAPSCPRCSARCWTLCVCEVADG